MSELDPYDFRLPQARIAQHPLHQRVDDRLLIVDRRTQSWETCHIRDLPELLSQRDMLILNDTRVVPARLVGYRKQTGGKWSGLFLELDDHGFWRILGKTRGRIEEGESVVLIDHDQQPAVELVMVKRLDNGGWVVKPSASDPPWELLERIGRVPLPPYIRGGEMEATDRERYQTVYAKIPGAVAAPTAGLHFTKSLLTSLNDIGVKRHHVTLHVGEGTFRPIQAQRLQDHKMHSEWGELTDTTAQAIEEHRRKGGRLIAVGTTSVRVLESAAIAADGRDRLSAWQGQTRLFIRPPYSFQITDALLTNFHLPKSTLMVLVCTFGGRELIQQAYRYAVSERFRFYSYGDAMLIV